MTRFASRMVLVLLLACFAFVAYAQQAFTFVQMCDTQLGMGGYDHDVATFKLAVKQINDLHPDFVLICGDLVNDMKDAGAFKDFNAIKAGFAIPCYCAAGNHDVGNHPTEDTLARYRKVIGPDYYTFENKGYAFVAINTSLLKAPIKGETEKQSAWLNKTLHSAAEKHSPTIVFAHYPIYVDTPDEKEQYFDLPLDARHQFLTLFKETGVVAYLSGHAHRNFSHTYQGIRLVTSATTCRNFDGAPMGFRIWHVAADGTLTDAFTAVKGAQPPAQKKKK